MKRRVCGLTLAGLLALAGLSGGGLDGPRPGDTVTPKLAQAVRWKAGVRGEVAVRLVAQEKGSGVARPLGFGGIPPSVNPVANVTFFDGSQELRTAEATLSHRC